MAKRIQTCPRCGRNVVRTVNPLDRCQWCGLTWDNSAQAAPDGAAAETLTYAAPSQESEVLGPRNEPQLVAPPPEDGDEYRLAGDPPLPETLPAPVARGVDSAAPATDKLGTLGRFELQAILGQGAFGRVYLAFDPRLDRKVALKVPRSHFDNPQDAARFLREAKAAARLKHPNIVAVYEAGCVGERYYIASEFVDGTPLSARIEKFRQENNTMPLKLAARIVHDLALALHYAHGEGVVHRDLKPGNVMLGSDGRPQVMDFGLARRRDDETMTADGCIVGTPAYMAPEQARGDTSAIGPKSDQYSLGVILYELLTNHRPFEGPPHQVVMRVASQEEPPRPRRWQRSLPLDLEAICRKAMEKAPERRYSSMDALAEDLRRWQKGLMIGARSLHWRERAVRAFWRQPVIASLIVFAILTTTVILTGSLLANRLLQARAAEAEFQKGEAVRASLDAAGAERKARLAAENEKLATAAAQRDANAARIAQNNAELQLGRVKAAEYVLRLTLAERDQREGDLPGALAQLNATEWLQRGWEHRYLWNRNATRGHAFPGHALTLKVLPDESAFGADGRELFTLGAGPPGTGWPGRAIYRWSTSTGKLLSTHPLPRDVGGDRHWILPGGRWVLSPTGERIANALCVWPLAGGEELLRIPATHQTLWTVSRDGRRLMVNDSTPNAPRLWNLETGQPLAAELADRFYSHVALSDDGALLATVSYRNQANRLAVYDADSGQERFAQSLPQGAGIDLLKFGPDPATLVVRYVRNEGEPKLRVLDPVLGDVRKEFSMPREGRVRLVGDRLVTLHEQLLTLYDLKDGRAIQTIPVGVGDWSLLSFCPPAREILSPRNSGPPVTPDGLCELLSWSLDSGKLVRKAPISGGWIGAASVSPEGRYIGASTARGVWSIDRSFEAPPPSHRPGPNIYLGAVMHPSGKRIACLRNLEVLQVWDWDEAKLAFEATVPEETFDPDCCCLAYDPEGRRIAVGREAGWVTIFDGQTGARLQTLKGPVPSAGRPLALSNTLAVQFLPDGKSMWAATADAAAVRWSLETGEADRVYPALTKGLEENASAPAIAFAAIDGRGERLAAIVRRDRESVVLGWNLATGELSMQADLPAGTGGLALSADGQWLAAPADYPKQAIYFWNWSRPEAMVKSTIGQGQTPRVAFSPDGRRAASLQMDNRLRLWDPATGAQLLAIPTDDYSPEQNNATFTGGKALPLFDPDGETIFAVGDNVERSWSAGDAPPRTLVHEGVSSTPAVYALAYDPVTGYLLGAGEQGISFDSAFSVWDVQTGQRVRKLGHSTPIHKFFLVGRTVLAGGAYGLWKWDLETGKELADKPGMSSRPGGGTAFALSPDGRRLAVGYGKQTLVLLDVETVEKVRDFDRPAGWTDTAFADPIVAIAYRPNGQHLATIAQSDGATPQVTTWDVHTGKELARRAFGVPYYNSLHSTADQTPQAVAYTPDGETVIAADGNGVVYLLDAETLAIRRELHGHTAIVVALAVDPAGKILASAGADLTVRFWSLDTGEPLAVRYDHTAPILSLAFRPDGRELASGATNGEVKLWETPRTPPSRTP